ncbi:MAG: carboxylating nicotinate-nucleotide diphosphorylase [Thermoanaerobaculia bacterium]
MSRSPSIPRWLLEELVRRALEEDLGQAGDLTSEAVVPPELDATGVIVARASGCLCGVETAAAAFRAVDETVEFEAKRGDGDDIAGGEEIARVHGRARSLLAAERTALNFLSHLSGIATATRELVRRIEGSRARVTCTRKTTPGLRALEKYAVRIGGGRNHRFGLDDAILVKDNHLTVAGGVGAAVQKARAAAGHTMKVEVEVEDLAQLEEALAAGADIVLLDNMPVAELTEAVARCRGRALTEASGGVDAETIAAVAATGVDLISVGWITHSAPALDLALDLESGC